MPSRKVRHVTGWRRRKLPNGRYLQIAITKEAGPRGGHTLAYVQQSKGGTVYPAKSSEPIRVKRKAKRKHGRTVKVRRK